MLRRFRNPRKFFSGLRKRICRIFKVDASRQDIDQKDGNTESEISFVLARHRRRLPRELEYEIFKFLKVEVLQKFVCGMGQGIYAYGIFRQKLLIKTKRICNPKANFWKQCNTKEKISCESKKDLRWVSLIWSPNQPVPKHQRNVFAEKGFPVGGELCRKADKFPGTILYYYEIRHKPECWEFRIGLSDGSIPEGSWVGMAPNSYARPVDRLDHRCRLSGKLYDFDPWGEWPRPKWDHHENVHGCGLLLEPNGTIYTFFTVNGTLMEKRFPISPSVDCLYPTYYQYMQSIVETNFGDDPTKPFNYDILKCPGMVFE